MTKITLTKVIQKYLFFLILLTILSVLVNGLNLYVPSLVGQTIDNLKNQSENLINTIYLILLVGVGYFVLSIIELIVATYFSEKFGKETRKSVMSNLTRQPYQYVINEGPAQIITVLGSDIDNIQDNFITTITFLFQAIALFIGAAILMFAISWKLALIAICSIPLIVVVFGIIFSKIGKLFSLSQKNLTDLNNNIAENINASSLIRVLSSYAWENAKYSNSSEQSMKISFKIIKAFSTMLPAVNLITNLTIMLILYFSYDFNTNGEITIGQITAFIGYYGLLITPIFILGFTSQAISQALASWKRIEPILNANGELVQGSFKEESFKADFVVQGLTLEFEGKKILDNLNFIIKDGQKTAILGPTGSGKSQLLNILVGLTQPTSGRILLNNKPITEYDQKWLMSNIGLCFQESLIFDSTLRYNITLGRKVSETQLSKAIDTANLRDYIDQNSLDTNIAERGGNLSGGQKQRVTLARALVLEPKLLLLDDFTARVDFKTEFKIRDSITQNYPQTTIVQIAQKIESIKNYNNIIVIMEGQIVGQGTHEELLESCPEYQQINQSQKLI
ncbi:MAG: ABC transporter ATP-binding protein [Patescibacteria group bacterium]